MNGLGLNGFWSITVGVNVLSHGVRGLRELLLGWRKC
jgi:hypothetical protein